MGGGSKQSASVRKYTKYVKIIDKAGKGLNVQMNEWNGAYWPESKYLQMH